MFRTLLCQSSGARYYDDDYHIGRVVLGLLYVGGEVRLGWSGVRTAARTLFQVLENSLLIYLLTYLLTYLLHDTESFLRS